METNEPTTTDANTSIFGMLNPWLAARFAAGRAEREERAAAWREWWAQEGERETERFWSKFRATEPTFPDPGPVPEGMVRLWLWFDGCAAMAVGRTAQDAREAAARAALEGFTDNNGDNGLNGRDPWKLWRGEMAEDKAVALMTTDEAALIAAIEAASHGHADIVERARELLANGAA